MPARRIVELGDPLLREISRPVEDLQQAGTVLRDMDETLKEFRRRTGWGRGISAVQVGEPLRLIFLRVDGTVYELINPVYTWRSEERFVLWDDCFSFPQLMVRLERHCAVGIRHQTLDGEWREFEAHGDLSELVQHEMDHLDGVLTIDRALDRDAFATRDEWARRLRD